MKKFLYLTVLLSLFAQGCSGVKLVSVAATPAELGATLLTELKAADSARHRSIDVYGCDSAETVLLFLVKEGGAYFFMAGSADVVPVMYAKATPPGYITRITHEDQSFKLWAGDTLHLTLSGYP